MHRRFITSLIITFFSLGAAMSHAAGAHVHGVAKMLVAMEGNNLQIELISPLDNLVGFERAPRNDKERKAVQKMMDQLNDPQALIVPTAAAKCTHSKTEIDAPILQSKSETEHVHDKNDGKHAEMEAILSFQCADPSALKSIEVRLFEAFPNLQRIQAEVAAPGGQAASSLDRTHRMLSW